MSATASLTATTLAVQPGSEASLELRVRNSGTVVDELQFAVVGDAAAWAEVEPPSVSLFPQGEATVHVHFRPPRSPAPPAGPMPFAVTVSCREDPMGGVAEEGILDVQPVANVTLELLPSVNRGRGGASYQIAVDNRGNTPVESTIAFLDTTEQLRGSVELPVVRSDPGWASFTELHVKPVRRFWRGTSQSKPFQVTLDSGDGTIQTVDGTFLQEAVLPKWLGKALLALAALAALLLILWALLMKPFIESTAEDAAKKEAAAATQAANEAKQAAQAAGATAQEAKDAADKLTTGTTAPPVTAAAATKTGFRLGGGSPSSYTVDAGKTLTVTDLVFGNPNGDSGTVELRKDGSPVLVLNLANYRDLDYHFVTPIEVKSGETLSLNADCGGCAASVFVSGELA